LPAELHHLLVERAAADRRSVNREIEALLWQAFTVNADAFAAQRSAVQSPPSPPESPRRPASPTSAPTTTRSRAR
jgi:hypothetical protein